MHVTLSYFEECGIIPKCEINGKTKIESKVKLVDVERVRKERAFGMWINSLRLTDESGELIHK